MELLQGHLPVPLVLGLIFLLPITFDLHKTYCILVLIDQEKNVVTTSSLLSDQIVTCL